MGIVTMTADAKAVRAASAQGVDFNVYLHSSYPLTGRWMMQKTIPDHLVSTYQLLECAFPQGIEEQEYLPLLSIFYEQMSDRNLAQVIAEFMGREYPAVLNDVYQVGAMGAFSAEGEETLNSVKQKLMRCDYEKWLIED